MIGGHNSLCEIDNYYQWQLVTAITYNKVIYVSLMAQAPNEAVLSH